MKPFLKILYTFSIVFIFLSFLPYQIAGAPAVSLSLDKDAISTNKIFSLELTLSWEGDADQYLVAPPQVTLPEGIEKKDYSFISVSRGDRYSLHYKYDLFAYKKGNYILEPVEVSYWEKGNNKEEKIRTEKLHIKVSSFGVVDLVSYWPMGVSVIVLAGLFIVLIVLYKKKKRCVDNEELNGVLTREMIASEMEQCNAYKIEGDWENYLKRVISIRNKLPTPDEGGKDMKELDALAERVTYGGFCPSTEEINLIQRQLEKAFKRSFPDDRDEDLDGIKLM
jgi:hypothetical protein